MAVEINHSGAEIPKPTSLGIELDHRMLNEQFKDYAACASSELNAARVSAVIAPTFFKSCLENLRVYCAAARQRTISATYIQDYLTIISSSLVIYTIWNIVSVA
jgi:hypothetical protein